MAEVEATCDQLTIIRADRVVESGALAHLRHLKRTFVSALAGTGALLRRFGAVFVALLAVVLVVRHTRATRRRVAVS